MSAPRPSSSQSAQSYGYPPSATPNGHSRRTAASTTQSRYVNPAHAGSSTAVYRGGSAPPAAPTPADEALAALLNRMAVVQAANNTLTTQNLSTKDLTNQKHGLAKQTKAYKQLKTAEANQQIAEIDANTSVRIAQIKANGREYRAMIKEGSQTSAAIQKTNSSQADADRAARLLRLQTAPPAVHQTQQAQPLVEYPGSSSSGSNHSYRGSAPSPLFSQYSRTPTPTQNGGDWQSRAPSVQSSFSAAPLISQPDPRYSPYTPGQSARR